MKLIVNTDGGARGNPGPAAGSFVIQSQPSGIKLKRGIYLGIMTNNQAEYLALINALATLAMILKLQPQKLEDLKEIVCLSDSQLLVEQLNGNYKLKSSNLKQLAMSVKAITSKIELPVSFEHIKRENNDQADYLVNLILDSVSQ